VNLVHKLVAILAFISLSCYASIWVSATAFWPAIFMGYGIPVCILLNAIFMLVLGLKSKKIALIPLVVLLLSSPFINATFQLEKDEYGAEEGFEVLSFNAKLFRKPGVYNQFSIKMIKWLVDNEAGIKCIQEFSYNTTYPALNVKKMLAEQGYQVHVLSMKKTHNPGVVIASKYPIIDKGIVGEVKNTMNNMIYADIDMGHDTIRVYNVHLPSTELHLPKKNLLYLAQNSLDILKKLKKGAQNRDLETSQLLRHAAQSPYPVIICGDLNEIPLSHNYFKIKKQFANAFEEIGSGFGFTYNSDMLPLRIDHHFYNEGVSANAFYIDQQANISDHLPIQVSYTIEP
jgi:endonuclease/exonuclease/phosphatase family metal-dependent hydrolase